MNQIKSKADCFEYFKSLDSENTVRKISQPVKITQLLGSSGRNGQRKSAITLSLPERITPYLKKASSQKKNVTNTYIKLPGNEQNVRRNLKFTEIPISVTKPKRCAKGINNENNMNNEYNQKKENLCLSRKSFLLPPNTIKELHMKNRFKQKRSEVSQFHILTMNSENINPRISQETSENYLLPLENTNTHTNSVVHVKKNKTSIVQSVSQQSLQTFNVNEQSGINILHTSDFADMDNNAVEKISENLNYNEISNVNICVSHNNDCKITTRPHLSSVGDTDLKLDANLYSDNQVDENNICYAERYSSIICRLPDVGKVKEANLIKEVDRERCLSTTMNFSEENLPSCLQTVKMISESYLDLQRNTNKDERVILNKTELTVLASKLKHLVCRFEEDVSDLKLMLTTVTKLLSATNMTNEEIKDNESKITQQITEITNLNDNIKVINNMDTNLSCITINDMEHDNALKETHKMLDINKSNFSEINRKDNKMQLSDQMYIAFGSNEKSKKILNSPIVKQYKKFESGTRRRSARLMTKVIKNLNATNDSFENLENELDIVNKKSNTSIAPLINQTSTKNKNQDKKIEGRPMKEYMALKSRMSCLSTPNIKRFNLSELKNNIHRETDDAKISVSDKLLTELYNLYEDSL